MADPEFKSDLAELAAEFGEEPANLAFDIGLMVSVLECLATTNEMALAALNSFRSKFVRANVDKSLVIE